MLRHTLGILLFVLVLYGLLEAWPLIRGPRLTIYSPKDHATTGLDGVVEVAGRAERVSVFTVNGAPLLYDQEGSFSSTMTFPAGSSILTFMAADRFGRKIVTTRTIFVPTQ